MNLTLSSEFPSTVLEHHTWSWWRRYWNHPPALVRKRCESWSELLEFRAASDRKARLATPKSKIFDDSRRRWDSLDIRGNSNFTLAKRFYSPTVGTKAAFQCPHGTLVNMAVVPHFECDASDIEGISNSKSADRPHESIDAFGAYYIDEQNRFSREGKPRLGCDNAGLKELLSHREIRLLHAPGCDVFSVRAWDGRLFVDNSGGSHHLAGAIHVAQKISVRIPITSKLYLYWLNQLTVQWLLDGFHLVLIPERLASQMFCTVRNLIGTCADMDFPPSLGLGTLLAFPKGTDLAECVMAELVSQGHHDWGVDLRQALDAQQQFLVESSAPWAKQFPPSDTA